MTKVQELAKKLEELGVNYFGSTPIRSYDLARGEARDLRTGKKASASEVLSGKLDLIRA